MIGVDEAREWSRRLREAEDSGVPIEPLVGSVPAGDVESAYLVQQISVEAWSAAGRRLVGRKIGLTNPRVQAQLGVDRPDFGALFADMGVESGGTVPVGRFLQPRVEAELAFILGSDVTDENISDDGVGEAVAAVAPAIEIVGSRIADWRISIVDTIADNGSSAGFVLGDERVPIDQVDLVGCAMSMTRSMTSSSGGRDAEVVSEGHGSDCLGSPLAAAGWLARELARRGHPLRAGNVVLTGALGPMVPARAGDGYRVEISTVGTVAVGFT